MMIAIVGIIVTVVLSTWTKEMRAWRNAQVEKDKELTEKTNQLALAQAETAQILKKINMQMELKEQSCQERHMRIDKDIDEVRNR